MRCPKCQEMLVRVEHAGVPMRECGSCYGAWMGEIPLKRLTRPTRDPSEVPGAAPQASLTELAALVTESNSKERGRCPECAIEMRKGRIHPLIPVEIDRCPKCRGAWLDAGELALIRRLYYELRTSDDPKLSNLREKIAEISVGSAPSGGSDTGGVFSSVGVDMASVTLDLFLDFLTD